MLTRVSNSLVNQTTSFRVELIDRRLKAPLPKGSGIMPIPILSRESPYLAIVNWCLIAKEKVSIGIDVIKITWIWKSLGIPVTYAILACSPLKEKASKSNIAIDYYTLPRIGKGYRFI